MYNLTIRDIITGKVELSINRLTAILNEKLKKNKICKIYINSCIESEVN